MSPETYQIAAGIALVVIPFVLGGIAAWLAVNKPKDSDTLSVLLYDLAQMAVMAAEQLYQSKQIQDRKAYAVKALQDALSRYVKTPLDGSVLEAAIEAAVYRLGKPNS